jgi:hypothetical protein
VGYTILGEDPALDWQVLPEYEGSGIERAALMWAKARPDKPRKQDEKRWGGELVSGSRQDDIHRIASLEQRNLQFPGRFLKKAGELCNNSIGGVPDLLDRARVC